MTNVKAQYLTGCYSVNDNFWYWRLWWYGLGQEYNSYGRPLRFWLISIKGSHYLSIKTKYDEIFLWDLPKGVFFSESNDAIVISSNT